MFEAVIFDLDGLLVDSEACQLAAWNQYLKQFEVQLEDREAGLLLDRRDFDNAELFRRRYDLAVDPLTIMEQHQEILLEMAEQIQIQPGAYELIEMLKFNELRLAIVSAGSREYIYAVTDRLGLEETFDVIVAGDMIDLSKPNPMPFLACAETFAIHPVNCLVLEDSRLGVESAMNAEMKVICVPGPSTERWRITGANMVLTSLDDINMPVLRSIWSDNGPTLQPQRQLQPERRSRPFRY